MNEQQRAEFEKNVALLPQAFQEAIRASDWEAKVIAIGQKQGLYYDQIDTIIAEVAVVLAGLESATNLEENIISAVELEPNKIDTLVQSLNQEIFIPLEASVRAKTEKSEPQFSPITASAQTAQQPSTIQQVTTGVFKVTPEKYSVKTLDQQKKNIDPYHEPIE